MMSAGRREDDRLLRGLGRFTADAVPDNLCHAVFLRSPHAHARILSIDCGAAAAMPGVLAVYTCADLAADGIADLAPAVALKRPDGSPTPVTPRALLVGERVRHAGEPVALVIATNASAALDALERIEVAYDPLPVVTSCAAASGPGASAIWAQASDNVAFVWRHGDAGSAAAATVGAAHIVRRDYSVSRVAANPMEPRVLVAVPEHGKLQVTAATQTPYALRDGLCAVLKMSKDDVRVIAGDVGGAFGLKADIFREDAAVCWAARRLGRPVRWMEDRSEYFVADDQARDVAMTVTLTLDVDGRFLALDVCYSVNLGAYVSHRSLGPITNIGGIAGVYRIGHIAAEVRGIFTNTVPTAPYRGAGRPDATYAIERIIDVAAGELGIDPIDLRRRNLVPASAMPYSTGFLFEYDCGDFGANMDAAEKLADVAGFPQRRSEAASRGRLRGLGVCNPIEVAGGPYSKVLPDQARLEVRPDGTVHVFTGAMSVGQGLETAWTQMLAERLGLSAEEIVYHQGDTGEMAAGRGSGGSAGLCVSGTAVGLAADTAIEAGRMIAADILEAAPADIEFVPGGFKIVGTDRKTTLAQVAAHAARGEPRGLVAEAQFQPPRVTFPNGCHVCEVEVDPETGTVEMVRYSVVEDIGRVLNPQLAHGQIHGGIAQGLGQALMEKISFDPDTGQLLTGSFMDYAMPRAADMPQIAIEMREVPTAVNALGAKGVGEAGTVGAMTATINAICAALAPLGVSHVEMPATPARVWSAIEIARTQSAGSAGG
jgi:aerobic carbon-monoxide dehydrogenase large subunit